MTSFAEKIESFTREFRDKLMRKHDAFFAFENEQRTKRVVDNVAEYICAKPCADQMFRELGAAMSTGLCPWMSDKIPRDWSLYTKLDVYLLGAARDLQLSTVRSVYEDKPETEDDDDDGCGSVRQLTISCTTALYMLLQTVPTTDKLRSLVDEFAKATKFLVEIVKRLDNCRHRFDCQCETKYKQASEDEQQARLALIVEIGNQPVLTDEMFQRGLGPFLIHRMTPVNNGKFAVMRKPEDEAPEKARIAQEERKQREANETRERKILESQIVAQEAAKKRAEDRLAELDNKKKKMKIDDSE